MSSILNSVKIGLKISLVLLPKFGLTALGLVLANTVALFSPFLAWQFWFPSKGKVSGVARKESGRSLEQGGPGSTVRLTPLEAAFVVCCFWGLGITSVEGMVIFSMQDVKPEMSWVLRAGQAAGLAIGLGLGLGLMALLVGGCAKFVEWGAREGTQRELKESAAKEKGEGWEKVEVESKEGEKEKENRSSVGQHLSGWLYRKFPPRSLLRSAASFSRHRLGFYMNPLQLLTDTSHLTYCAAQG